MMELQDVLNDIIQPALVLLPEKMDSFEAKVLLLAIGLQESKFIYRRQMGNGPAKGFWQFEEGGSVKGVMQHPATKPFAQKVCDERGVAFDRRSVWNALEKDDVLAACFARLNLWWVPGSLPEVDDMDGAWTLYANVTWRPGKPHYETWPRYHLMARQALGLA